VIARKKPTHAQAQLQLQLYDLRREAMLRQAREWFTLNYFADSLEDSNRIAPPGSQEGTYVMMVLSYWDQACCLLNYDLLHKELFFETGGEFFAIWQRIKPVVPGIREKYRTKHFLANLEKTGQRFENLVEERSPGNLEMMRQYMHQMRSAKA
jgi:hypothetical protein